ncbi:MAG: energy transducer TonB [Bryobacteraceae bacterium]|nr:energy transducer TonB [Bryobacteraceae bacterium]
MVGVFGLFVAMTMAPGSAAEPLLRLPELLMERRLLVRVEPEYPPLARAWRITGDVRLQVLISRTGAVTRVRVVSGHPLLTRAATRAVRSWLYSPFQHRGESVDVLTFVTISFPPPRPAPTAALA